MCILSDWLTPDILSKVRPYRNVFIFLSAMSIFFSILVVVENVVFVAMNNKQHAILLLLPYVLSWILIVLGCIFARVAYLLHTRRAKRFAAVRPHSPSAWSIDSRPVSPSPSTISLQDHPFNLSASSTTALFRQTLQVPHSPFCISDGMNRYHDDPPAYHDVVSRASPQPPIEPLQMENV